MADDIEITNAAAPDSDAEREQLLREGPRQPFSPFKGFNAKPADGDKAQDAVPQDIDAADEHGDEPQPTDAANADGYELRVSGEVPQQFYEETQAHIQQAGVLAKELGIPQPEVQRLADYAVSLAVSDPAGTDLSNKDACLNTLMTRYGDDEGRNIISAAQRAVVRLGPKVAAFLDESSLGNSPAVLAALAALERGDLRMSPENARAELNKLTKGDRRSAYFNANDKGHKAAVDRANMLYMLAYPEGAEDAVPETEAPSKDAASSATAALDAKIREAIEDPAYLNAGHPKHREAVTRATALYEQRYKDE